MSTRRAIQGAAAAIAVLACAASPAPANAQAPIGYAIGVRSDWGAASFNSGAFGGPSWNQQPSQMGWGSTGHWNGFIPTPPRDIAERVPAIPYGYAWTPGSWRWDGHGYRWIPGRLERASWTETPQWQHHHRWHGHEANAYGNEIHYGWGR